MQQRRWPFRVSITIFHSNLRKRNLKWMLIEELFILCNYKANDEISLRRFGWISAEILGFVASEKLLKLSSWYHEAGKKQKQKHNSCMPQFVLDLKINEHKLLNYCTEFVWKFFLKLFWDNNILKSVGALLTPCNLISSRQCWILNVFIFIQFSSWNSVAY